MKPLFALLALIALVLAPLAYAPALATGPERALHCEQTMPAMDHGQQPMPLKMDATCYPAAAPAALGPASATGEPATAPPALATPGTVALLGIDPVIEVPPPRA